MLNFRYGIIGSEAQLHVLHRGEGGYQRVYELQVRGMRLGWADLPGEACFDIAETRCFKEHDEEISAHNALATTEPERYGEVKSK